jgi:hypothetical protein
MAHLVNNVHETFGVEDPEASNAKEQTWSELLPTIIAGLRAPETVHASLALLGQMAIVADRNEKKPGR